MGLSVIMMIVQELPIGEECREESEAHPLKVPSHAEKGGVLGSDPSSNKRRKGILRHTVAGQYDRIS
ncbi:hypothetical protein [uncultured Gemmobacter sp.]|uniref:hypothetical protein n=1 Tax=uncultured Gemmobacter sp. TaxID=1095917 RepID=UPI000A60AE03|nr:hypothetical protein [uncultured Gemmobacter sp.]